MVVAVEDEVESVDRLHGLSGGILLVVGCVDAVGHARVHDADDVVGLFFFLHSLDPLGRAVLDIFKLHAFPCLLRNPVGDGWCDEAEDGNLESLAVEHLVGWEVGLACGGINYVGSEDGETALLGVFVEDGFAHLYVVVAYDGDIVADIVADVGYLMAAVDAVCVEIVGCGLALQHVASVDEEHVAWCLLYGMSYVGMYPLEASFAPVVMSEIVRKIVAVYIGGKYYFKMFVCSAHVLPCLVK